MIASRVRKKTMLLHGVGERREREKKAEHYLQNAVEAFQDDREEKGLVDAAVL